jgi:CYTH domain-containing protein
MALEIERKFRVAGEGWRSPAPGTQTDGGVRYTQGYLNRDKARTVRVRVAGAQGWLTIKGQTHGATRVEFEYPIPLADAQSLLLLCDGTLIDKTRHTLTVGTTVWEVDEFHGDNAGLVVAEVELTAEDQPFDRPDWLGDEVTHDTRYFNSALIAHPFGRW